ncbi:MAG TPA: hypothetical protein VGK18_06145 [Propionicimonas sp.]|jgi:hypothetical protein|uniref:hypothetical protein n=1 Tax=Propionicimonas sp. TaxID=1955623 RepID=UPI002F426959
MTVLPEPVFDHLRRLTDAIGLHEHALGDVPRPEHGYCVDDAARALVLTCCAADPALDGLAHSYLDVVLAAIAPDGRCHNRLDTVGRWEDAAGLGDWWGRAVWALGVTAARGPLWARRQALGGFESLAGQRSPWLRSMAYACLGAAELCDTSPAARLLLADAAAVVVAPPASRPGTAPDWLWPEARLRYDNARLPEALIAAGNALGRPDLVTAGLDQLRFLLDIETTGGHLSVTPVGGRGPGERGPAFDQQPIDVAGIADACLRAWRVTGDPRWREGVSLAWAWFGGGNDADIAMYDPDTGAGYDGLHAGGRNFNRGAESTIAALATLIQARTAGADECPVPSRTIQTSTWSPISSG